MKYLVLGFLSISAAMSSWANASDTKILASDKLFLGSILSETWDSSRAQEKGYIECMMPLSDVDLSVVLKNAGVVTLNFDTGIYPSSQAASAGPVWMVEVDGHSSPYDRITIGPAVSGVLSPVLEPGSHRVKFIQVGNVSGSRRWAPSDPQLSRVTGVSIPEGARLEKSQRPVAWFLPITDSIGEGALDINATRETFWTSPKGVYTNAYYAWPSIAARLLNKSVAGYLISGIGIVRGGTGAPFGALNKTDPKDDPWDHVFSGVPRPFNSAPDFILLCIGTNEFATDPNTVGHGNNPDEGSSDAPFQANLETFFARVRAHSQLAHTPIYVSVPFGGYKRTALQNAIAAYRLANPGESQLYLFDLAFGSPALITTTIIDEKALFGGLTKNRPDDKDTIPSPQAADRTHPYGIATPRIGTVNAHEQLAQAIAPRLAAMLRGEAAPETANLACGKLDLVNENGITRLHAEGAVGGSAPYLYQFERSDDGGSTWSDLGPPITSMRAAIDGISTNDPMPRPKSCYRMVVTDAATPRTQAASSIVAR